MQIILRGPAAGYEAEHTARIFFPGAEKAEGLPETEDFVLAESHEMTDLILVRKDGRLYWRTDLRSPEADPEYALCKLEFGLLKDLTGIDPPWGMMTGVRPVRIIHDLRAAGESEEAIAEKFLDHFACTPEKFKLALGIADLQRPVLDAANSMDCSIYAGIPFCPTRCSYCSFVSRTVGDKATRALVQPYVDKLCRELTAIRETADRCGLRIRTFYIGGGTPTALSAAQLEQLMSRDTTGMRIILIDNPRQLEMMHAQNPSLADKFECIGCEFQEPEQTEEKEQAPVIPEKSCTEEMPEPEVPAYPEDDRPIRHIVPESSSAMRMPGPGDYYEDDREPEHLEDEEEMDIDEFAQYACKYASEIDCSITGKSMLALYERIEIMEEDGIPLTRAAAEDLIEEAADKAERPSVGRRLKGLFSSKYDKDGLLILKEEHFI